MSKHLSDEWRKILYDLNNLTFGEVETRTGDLEEKARTLNISSLIAACRQLRYIKEHGVQSINVGGAMGSGKTAIAEVIAQRLGFEFIDSDYFHPIPNVEKQRRGIPLTSADRVPFLQEIQTFLKGSQRLTTCSALVEAYRAILAGQDVEILLDGGTFDPWDMKNLNLGLIQVMVVKPYEIALEELDASAKGFAPPRLFDNQPHFIQVTRESEEEAKRNGRHGLLANQHYLQESSPIKPGEALVIDVMNYRGADGTYDGERMIEDLPEILRKPKQIDRCEFVPVED